jgi:hypothetical protein
MYGNLKRRNLGDFKNEWYWSSTDRSVYYGEALSQNLGNGQMGSGGMNNNRNYVRPIRQVPGA